MRLFAGKGSLLQIPRELSHSIVNESEHQLGTVYCVVSLGCRGTTCVLDDRGAILAERSCKLVGEAWRVEETLLVGRVENTKKTI